MEWQDAVMEPQSAGSPTSPSSPGAPSPELTMPSAETPPSTEETPEEAAVKPVRQSSSSSSSRASSAGSLFHLDTTEMSTPLVAAEPDDDHAVPAESAEAKPDDWAAWPEQPAKTVDDPFVSDGGAVSTGLTREPEAQTMAMPAPAPADNGFNPERIPASIFQAKSSSQAEWSIASNESLFSIHGAGQSDDLGGLYAASRSHFDYFYDEAMAAAGGGEPDWKLPPLAEGSEPPDFSVPGSAGSDASGGSAPAKKAIAFRRHDSGSSSSNFSFAFPILADTSPRKRESAGAYGYYKLQKEYSRPAPPADPASAFEEMTEEERRRKTGWCCCGECCGCCWFDCSWSSCCSCCQWRWRCCCCCSFPSCCRCSWCL